MASEQSAPHLQVAINAEEWLCVRAGRLVIRGNSGDLILSPDFRYRPGRLWDRLVDGSIEWRVDKSARDAVCELVARFRLDLPFEHLVGTSGEQSSAEAVEHSFLEYPSQWWREWIIGRCGVHETVLAVLRTGEEREIISHYDEREAVRLIFVWTSRRMMLVRMGRLGDFELEELQLPLAWHSAIGRDSVQSGSNRFLVGRNNRPQFLAISHISSCATALWKVGLIAALVHLDGATTATSIAAKWHYAQDPAVAWSRPLWDEEFELLSSGGEEFSKLPEPSFELLELWRLWELLAEVEIEVPERLALERIPQWLNDLDLAALLEDRAFSPSWPLGIWLAFLVTGWPAGRRSQLLALLGEIAKGRKSIRDSHSASDELGLYGVLALLYESCDERHKAHELLTEAVSALPSASDLELLVGEENVHAPLSALLDSLLASMLRVWPEGHIERTQVLELRASLDPLDQTRLQAWATARDLDPDSRRRIHLVFDQISGLQDSSMRDAVDLQIRVDAFASQVHRPLTSTQIDEQLNHPAAQHSHSGSLQALLAKVQIPDHSELKKYCDPGQEEHLRREVALAASLFDKPTVDAFISHGDHRFGVRAHEGSPSFVIVGGEHRRPEAAAFLSPAELRFALGAEMAHLFLGHSRVTSQEVWDGAFDKGKATFEMFASLVPLLSVFPWGRRLGRWTHYLENKLLTRTIGRIRKYFGDDSPTPESVSLDRSVGLIAAHRMMQLSADRAGLLLSGRLDACILAMWKMHPQSLAQLPELQAKGPRVALQSMADAGIEHWRQLKVRCAALSAFAWSPEYHRLRRWVWGPLVTPALVEPESEISDKSEIE